MGNFDEALIKAIGDLGVQAAASMGDYQRSIAEAVANLEEIKRRELERKLQDAERKAALKRKPLTESELAKVSSELRSWDARLNR